MEQLRTIALDIRESVFQNDSEGILYLTKDIYSDSIVVAIPVVTFSWEIKSEHDIKALETCRIDELEKYKTRLIEVINKAIDEL